MGSHTSLTTRIKVEIQRGAAAKARLTHPECYLVRRGSTSDHHTIHAMRALHGSSHPKLAFSSVRAGAISAPAQPEVARAAANARQEPQSRGESRRLTRRTGQGGPGAKQSPRQSSTPQHAEERHHRPPRRRPSSARRPSRPRSCLAWCLPPVSLADQRDEEQLTDEQTGQPAVERAWVVSSWQELNTQALWEESFERNCGNVDKHLISGVSGANWVSWQHTRRSARTILVILGAELLQDGS